MKIAIIYGSTTGMTQIVAGKIKERLGDLADEPADVSTFNPERIADYDALLLGIPTWNIGEMQEEWEDVAPKFLIPELQGKRVAMFGLGDQMGYPDTFGDALGLLWDIIEPAGPVLFGRWPTEGYEYEASAGERDGTFLGLMCDDDQQPELTEERLDKWCAQVLQELGAGSAVS